MRTTLLILLGVSCLVFTSCNASQPESPSSHAKVDEPAEPIHRNPGKKANHKDDKEKPPPKTTKRPHMREWDWKEDKKIAEANGWIWTGADMTAGFHQARKTGKPLMIVLRCPP